MYASCIQKDKDKLENSRTHNPNNKNTEKNSFRKNRIPGKDRKPKRNRNHQEKNRKQPNKSTGTQHGIQK